MKKFKCYKCGAIAAVDDSAQRATAERFAVLCRLNHRSDRKHRSGRMRRRGEERKGASRRLLCPLRRLLRPMFLPLRLLRHRRMPG